VVVDDCRPSCLACRGLTRRGGGCPGLPRRPRMDAPPICHRSLDGRVESPYWELFTGRLLPVEGQGRFWRFGRLTREELSAGQSRGEANRV